MLATVRIHIWSRLLATIEPRPEGHGRQLPTHLGLAERLLSGGVSGGAPHPCGDTGTGYLTPKIPLPWHRRLLGCRT